MIVSVLALAAALPLSAQKSPPIADSGQSDWVIYCEPDAPQSVLLAADELQRIVRESTAAKLPIVNDPERPMICLGDNAASRAAGVTADDLPDDGFRIRAVDGNLYIVGADRREWSQ